MTQNQSSQIKYTLSPRPLGALILAPLCLFLLAATAPDKIECRRTLDPSVQFNGGLLNNSKVIVPTAVQKLEVSGYWREQVIASIGRGEAPKDVEYLEEISRIAQTGLAVDMTWTAYRFKKYLDNHQDVFAHIWTPKSLEAYYRNPVSGEIRIYSQFCLYVLSLTASGQDLLDDMLPYLGHQKKQFFEFSFGRLPEGAAGRYHTITYNTGKVENFLELGIDEQLTMQTIAIAHELTHARDDMMFHNLLVGSEKHLIFSEHRAFFMQNLFVSQITKAFKSVAPLIVPHFNPVTVEHFTYIAVNYYKISQPVAVQYMKTHPWDVFPQSP